MSQRISTSRAWVMDAGDWKKTLRDLGFFLLAALVTAFGTWWEGFAQDNSGAAWVAVLAPVVTAGIAALIAGLNRWRRNNQQPEPEPIPVPPDGLSVVPNPRTQWD